MAADDLYVAASELLDACVAILATTVGGVPERVFVGPGLIADDCNQLSVRVGGINEDDKPADDLKRTQRGRVNLPTYIIRIVRCVQTSDDKGNAAPVIYLDAAGQLVLQDLWALWNGIMAQVRAGELFDACAEFYMDGADAVVTTGNEAGFEITIRAALNGYTPTIGT